jgi:hypothetical protein
MQSYKKKLEELRKGEKLVRITGRKNPTLEEYKGIIFEGGSTNDPREDLYDFGGYVCTKEVMHKMFQVDGGLFHVFV